MSKRSETGDSESKVVDIRLKIAVFQKVERCWKAGAYKDEARAKFLGYLVSLGVARYEAKILPEELGGTEEAMQWPKREHRSGVERRSGIDRRDRQEVKS